MSHATPDTVTIAHLTDVHLPPLPPLGLRHWNVKRGLGFLNWQRKRRHVHRADVLEAILADVRRAAPDHIAVTGDLVNIGLPAEYEQAARWLSRLGTPERVSVVPGNHDIYVRLMTDIGTERWRAYMSDVGAAAGAAPFPYLRRIGPVALIGINSAHPTPPFVAAGRVGSPQRERLGDMLDAAARQGLCRVVLIHHPPLVGQAGPMRGLSDAREFEDLLLAHGAEVVLHGHNHRHMQAQRRPPGGEIAVLGLPSASAGAAGHGEALAAWQGLSIRRDEGDFEIATVVRGLKEPGSAVVEIERRAWRSRYSPHAQLV